MVENSKLSPSGGLMKMKYKAGMNRLLLVLFSLLAISGSSQAQPRTDMSPEEIRQAIAEARKQRKAAEEAELEAERKELKEDENLFINMRGIKYKEGDYKRPVQFCMLLNPAEKLFILGNEGTYFPFNLPKFVVTPPVDLPYQDLKLYREAVNEEGSVFYESVYEFPIPGSMQKPVVFFHQDQTGESELVGELYDTSDRHFKREHLSILNLTKSPLNMLMDGKNTTLKANSTTSIPLELEVRKRLSIVHADGTGSKPETVYSSRMYMKEGNKVLIVIYPKAVASQNQSKPRRSSFGVYKSWF